MLILIGVILVVIMVGCIRLGERFNELDGDFKGFAVGFLIAIPFMYFSLSYVGKAQSSIPYHTIPDVVYETLGTSQSPTYQFCEDDDTLMIITADGKTRKEQYTELEFKTDGKSCIEVYKKDDYGIMWIWMNHQQKIVIHVEERSE